jgi:signal transduction histidine kinase
MHLMGQQYAQFNNKLFVQLTIQDNGPGIKEEVLHRVFEPFFTTKTGGIGMGLSISRSLIEESGGKLWLEPYKGAGAIFHLTLPLASSRMMTLPPV